MSDTDVGDALTHAAQEHSGRVLATLARRFGDLDLADDAVQDALAMAATRWPDDGVPDNPAAWLTTVARNRAIDRLRREAAADRRALRTAPELYRMAEARAEQLGSSGELGEADRAPLDARMTDADAFNLPGFDDGEFGDERLRLMLLCCHPAINRDAQTALVLRLVAGLTTEEIAAAYLVRTATVAQRIARAKKKIRTAGIPMTVPDDIAPRLRVVLDVLYLMFNEGYLARRRSDVAIRVDLCEQAMALTELVAHLAAADAEALGLAALQRFVHARRDARIDADGRLVPLDEQDRSRWHRNEIGEGNSLLRRAMTQMRPGPYQLQAAIAAHHVAPADAAHVDWAQVVALYDQLVRHDPSPVVRLNRACALANIDGAAAALRAVEEIEGLDEYHLWHAAQADLAWRIGDLDRASAGWQRAIVLTDNPAEMAHLQARLGRIG